MIDLIKAIGADEMLDWRLTPDDTIRIVLPGDDRWVCIAPATTETGEQADGYDAAVHGESEETYNYLPTPEAAVAWITSLTA